MRLNKRFLTRNDCYNDSRRIKPIGMQLHTIGTGQNTAESLASYWDQPGIECCVHYLVDAEVTDKVLQLMPDNYRSWADGGYGNNNLITVELMESDYMKYTGGAHYAIHDEAKFKADVTRAYKTAVKLFAMKCKEYGWDPTAKLPNGLHVVSSHDEGRRLGVSTAHVDPTHIWDKYGWTMDGFRKDVKAAMAGITVDTPTEEKISYYRVRKTWADAKSQLGAYEKLENAKANCPYGYSVFDESGKVIYSNTEKVTGTQTSEFAGMSEPDSAAKLLEVCKPIAEKYGLFPSVAAAQTILESGYCKTTLAVQANNVCGMKCTLSGNTWVGSTWDGVSKVNIRTAEQDKTGNVYYVYADFRKYPNIEASISDRCAYLLGAMNGSKPRYEGIKDCKNYTEQITLIKNGGYATDVNYPSKIINIIKRFGLDKYDKAPAKPSAPAEPPKNNGTKIQADLLAKLASYQKRLEKDLANKKKWIYSNSGASSRFSAAVNNGNRKCNCALLARWALRDLGLLNSDNFWGEKGGIIIWRGTSEKQIKKNFDVIKINNVTVDTLLKTNQLMAGDILTYKDMQHTNVYAGNGKWYDGGHAYCSGSGEGAKFKAWYGSTKHGAQRVAYIIRAKGAKPNTEPTKPENEVVYRVGTAWTNGKCENQKGAFSVLANAKKCADSARSSEKKTFHVYDNKGKVAYTAEYASDTYVVQAGVFSVKANADALVTKLKRAKFDAIVVNENGSYVVRCGTFSVKKNAENLVASLKAKGFNAVIK